MHFVVLPRFLIIPTGLILAFLVVVMWLDARSLIPVYHTLMLGVALPLVHRYRGAISRRLQRLPMGFFWRIILLGYAAVIAEETLVGVLHGLQEDASVPGVVLRIGQFIAFNLFAFTGLIFGMALLHRFTRLGRWDLFLLCGLWGIYAEGLIFKLANSPIVAGGLLIPTMAVYALIMLPGQLAAPQPHTMQQHPLWVRALLALPLFWILSIAPIIALSALRVSFPDAFPPCDYIACN